MVEATERSGSSGPRGWRHWASSALVIFATAFAVRALAMLVLRSWEFPPENRNWAAGWETGRIALHLVGGEGFSLEAAMPPHAVKPTAWLAPLYPALVSVVFWALGAFSKAALVTVLLLQSALAAGTCALLARLGRELGAPAAGVLAAYLAALSPALINMSVRVLWGSSLLTFEGVLLVLLFLGQERHGGRLRAGLLGLAVGLTLLTSPTPAIFVALAALWLLARRGRTVLPELAVVVVVSSLVVAPWIVRNRAHFGSWFFIKSNAQNELFIGNNPLATGAYVRALDVAREVLSPEEFEALADRDEVQRSRALGRHAMAWIRDEPGSFTRLTLGRIHDYWRARFVTAWEALPLGPARPMAGTLYGVAHDLLLLLALAGAWLGVCRSRRWALPLAYLAGFPVAYYLTHVSISRYRFPVVPLVLLLAAVALVKLWRVARGVTATRAR